MTKGNPAKPMPHASQRSQAIAGHRGSSVLALLDAIRAPHALLALWEEAEIPSPATRTFSCHDAADSKQADNRSRDRDLAVHAYSDLFRNLSQDQRLNAFWLRARRRSVASAYVSEFLHGHSSRTGPFEKTGPLDIAFAAGLLHDIGTPALATVVPKSYQRVIEDFERTGQPLCEVERAVLGTDHTAAGAHLLLRWGVCRELRDGARLHHLPWHTLASAREQTTLVRLVNVADAIVGRADGAGLSWEDESRWLAGGNLLGVNAKVIDEAAELARAKLSELALAGGLATGEGVPTEDSNSLGRSPQAVQRVAYAGEQPAVDQEPGDWDQATRQLLQSAPGFWFATDICQAAAGHLLQVIGLRSCVVVVEDRARGVRSVASATIGQPGGSLRCGLDHADRGMDQTLPASTSAPGRGVAIGRIVPAREEHVHVWRRCALGAPVGSMWIRPWVWAEDLHLLAIFEADSDQITAYEARLAPDGAFAAVLEALVRLVTRQEEEQQTLDTVLDATRRAGLHTRGEIWSRSVSLISEVAAGAAHEINNPLAVISGRAQMELARAEDPRLSKSLEAIVEQAERTSGIIMELVEFAKPTKPDPALHALDGLLVPALQHWQARSGLFEHQVLVGFFDPALTVLVDQDHFRQIIVALLENAVSAMDSKSAALHINSPSRPSDEQIRIVIEDNGVGMDARVLAHAMAPFFSNRTAGRGRGFGLSRACRFAELNGGTLWLESSPNTGTRAIVGLPAR